MINRAIQPVPLLLAVLGTACLCPAADDGVIRQWLLAGPFTEPKPREFLQQPPLGPLQLLAPSAGGAVGGARWVEHTATTGVVDFRDPRIPVKSVRHCVVAGFAYIYCPRMAPARLLLGFQYGLAVFLNGRRVFHRESGGRLTPNAYTTEVLLGKGWNRLLVLNARYGAFRWVHGFYVRVAGEDLEPIAGLKFATKNPFPEGKPVTPEYRPYLSAYTVEHFGTHRLRVVNRTPIDLKGVSLVVRDRAGRRLMGTSLLGVLKGHSYLEVGIDVDEVFYQRHFPGATAEITFVGGKLQCQLQPMTLEGVHSIEYETPHIQRMRPWAAGRPAILLLTRGRTRQAVELFERGDFEWHWIDTTEKDAAKQLTEELKLYRFDCLVVAAQDWRRVPKFQLLEQAVARGLGVVYVNPVNLTPVMAAALGIAPVSPQRPGRPGRLQGAAEHPVVAGVPLAYLPPVAPAGYELTKDAKVLAKVGERAVIAVTEKPGRRSVLLSLGRGAQLIWPIRRERFLDARLPIWERQWSLLLKAINWAAKKESAASLALCIPARVARGQTRGLVKRPGWQEGLKLGIRLSVPEARCTARVAFRSRGLMENVRTLELREAAKQVTVSPPVPRGLDAGENEVDVTLLDRAGKVLTWATAVFEIEPRGSLGPITVQPARDCYLPTEKLTFTVAGKAQADGLRLIARLADNRGRVVWRQVRPVGRGDFSETFSLRPVGMVTPVGRFQARLVAHDHLEAEAQHIFFVRRELIWDSYEPVLWLTRHRTRWYYDIEYFRMLREKMWIPNGWSAQLHPRGSAYYQMVYGGFNRVGLESLHFFSMNHNWTKATFERRRRNFRRTKDIRWLYRTPIDPRTKKPVDRPDYDKLRFGNDPHNSFFPLDDPDYLEWTRKKIAWQLKRVGMFNPIIYDLMDEGSYTSYARAFDFDFSPVSLKHFRAWLKKRYRTLEALNKQWETNFQTWQEVMPMHTDQVRRRARGKKLPNYGPWVDHRKYNDLVFSRYIKHCSESARAGGDGDACVGIGGGQRPNPYGGWDYWLVANHFTWIENYFEDTDEYIRSFNTPDRRLKMCPGKDVWKCLSHGGSGFYRWVDYNHIRGDFSLLPRGRTTARQLAEVRGGGLAKLFLAAKPVDDPIGIHYSQSTIQVSYVRGGPGSADQFGNGGPLVPKLGFYNLLEELGYQYKFVAYAQLEAGHLQQAGYRLFILPESLAISDLEAQQLKRFVEAGGVLLADRWVGQYDGHGRKRATSVLKQYFQIDPSGAAEKKLGKGWVVYLNSTFPRDYWANRNVGQVEPYWQRMRAVLAKAHLPGPRARVYCGQSPARRTEIRYFQLGKIRYHIVRAEVPGTYRLVSTTPGHLYDMRRGRYAGRTDTIEVNAEPSFPALVALSPYRVQSVQARPTVRQVPPGQRVEIAATVEASAPPGAHMLNFRLYGPKGRERRWYGSTLLAPNGAARLSFQTALNDARGQWTVKVTDLASGITGEASFEIR
ncbi:MAG: hypothetical protein B1H04_02200 [Planctomycetales bacterium 4484_123]|nr:MAG: hypothetical protein B1H04_02200 [Planctomycetales bacterium 4484_123]